MARFRDTDGGWGECVSLRLTPPVPRLDFWAAEFWADHRQLRQRHREELREALAIAQQQALDPIVLGGDFNMVPLDPVFAELRPEFQDAFVGSGTGWGATGAQPRPLFRVDQIWLPQSWRPARTFARSTRNSDHRLVVCDVERRP